jgi:PAS domain-containing protein
LGYTIDELQILGVEGIRKPLPDGSTFSEHLQELKQNEKGLTDYAILVCKDGSEIFMEANVRTINRGGNDYNIVIVRDITERVEYIETIEFNHRQTQQYLSLAKVLIMALDKEMNITMINQEGTNILGYTQEEIIGKNWLEHFVPNGNREVASKILHDLLEQKK